MYSFKPMIIRKNTDIQPLEYTIPFEQDEFTYQNGGIVFIAKKIKWNDDKKNKYSVAMIKDGRHCGKFTFFLSDEYAPPELIFSGMYLDPEFREQGLSKVIMTELQRLANASGRHFDHALPQRKPLTCMILQKYGFEACKRGTDKTPDSRDTVYVAREISEKIKRPEPGQSNPVYVFFPSPHKAREFANSDICKSQPYIVLPEINNIRESVRCVLNVHYVR
jgi:hypothetical protein